VVDGGDRAKRLTHTPAGNSQTVEGLRGGHFVHEMEIYVKERTAACRFADHMAVPYLLEKSALGRHELLL
jgi:hypothetical protein